MSAPAGPTVWCFARNALAERVLTPAVGDVMGRFLVELTPEGLATLQRAWGDEGSFPVVVHDTKSGLVVRLWQADCGGGCRCAVEVGVWAADTLPTVPTQAARR